MVSLIILNYNSEKLLKTCLDSVLALDFAKKEVIFIDNASSDGSVAYVLKHYSAEASGFAAADGSNSVRVIANKENSGYAGGANQAVSVSSGEFVMILNPDIVFEANYLKILVERLREDPKIGAIIGKLRKFDFTAHKKTNLIDSAGLVMYRNRRCVDRGQGEEDRGQYDKSEEVFGVTGACPLYRRAALEDCRVPTHFGATEKFEYFDNDFFMYKEDVDLSWRMGLFEWKSFYEPAALAYHGRGTGVIHRASLWDVAKNRGGLSKFQKYYSYKNERLMRVKNELLGSAMRDFFHIAAKEILMFGWMCVREPFLWKSFFHFLKQLPAALRKRSHIMRNRRVVRSKEVLKYFS